jgi:hypothetical protein
MAETMFYNSDVLNISRAISRVDIEVKANVSETW